MAAARKLLKWAGWALMALFSVAVAWISLDYLYTETGSLRLAPNPPDEEWALRLHALGGLVALAAGPWQFLPFLRRRAFVIHRWIGYVYLGGIGLGVAGASVLAFTPMGGEANSFSFGMLAILWAAASALALRAALARNLADHRRWMIRSFALTFAAVTLRLGMITLPMAGFSQDAAYAVVAWASWTINIIVIEWILLPALERQTARAG